MTTVSSIRIQDSIATKLMVTVFSIYLLVTITLTLCHMFGEYLNAKESVIAELKVVQKMVEPGIAQSLWQVDHAGTRSILVGLLETPSIIGVQIKTKEEHNYALGTIKNEKGQVVRATLQGKESQIEENTILTEIFTYSFPITYMDKNDPIQIAEGVFYSNSRIVFNKVQLGFMFIMFNAILKTMSLWIIFLWVSNRLLTRPLSKMTEVTQQLDLDRIDQSLMHVDLEEKHELRMLSDAFNTMLKKLNIERQRTASLRIFSAKLANFNNVTDIMHYAFEELCDNMLCDHAVFYWGEENGKFLNLQQRLPHCQFLNKLPVIEFSQAIFREKGQQISIFNASTKFSTVAEFYGRNTESTVLENFAFMRILEIPGHMFVFYRQEHADIFDGSDLEYLKSMIQEIKLAYQNINALREKGRMESELKTAAAVQHALFPRHLPQIENLQFASFFQSATETGGDWYGFISELENNLYILIGDVTGHGVPSALVTATACATCQALTRVFVENKINPSPAELLRHLNEAVFNAGRTEFLMTFFIARIDLKTLQMTFSNAGHNFPIWYQENQKVKHLLNSNVILGHDCKWDFSEATVQLQKGDTLFFFTDGLVENNNAKGEMMTEAKLKRNLKNLLHLNAKELVQQVVQDAFNFYEGQALDDDITIVACKVL